MGLLAEARAYKPARVRCSVALLLEGMEPDLRAELVEALADSSITVTGISAALKVRDITINDGTLLRHRNKKCSCPQ